jgi:hypothetical protein
LQVCHSGVVPTPSLVSREDVASLAVAAALFHNPDKNPIREPFHLTLGVRWVGPDMGPYPAQGRKADGLPDANSALQRCLKTVGKAEKRKRRVSVPRKRNMQGNDDDPETVVRFANNIISRKRRRLKPYGICVAVPVYFFLASLAKALIKYIPGGATYILPVFGRVNELLLMLVTYVIGKLILLLPFVVRRKQYIPFYLP